MENDLSARAFDAIACKSGQFGFFQKRIFFINALIQSACLSVLLYTSACMPKVDDRPVLVSTGINATPTATTTITHIDTTININTNSSFNRNITQNNTMEDSNPRPSTHDSSTVTPATSIENQMDTDNMLEKGYNISKLVVELHYMKRFLQKLRKSEVKYISNKSNEEDNDNDILKANRTGNISNYVTNTDDVTRSYFRDVVDDGTIESAGFGGRIGSKVEIDISRRNDENDNEIDDDEYQGVSNVYPGDKYNNTDSLTKDHDVKINISIYNESKVQPSVGATLSNESFPPEDRSDRNIPAALRRDKEEHFSSTTMSHTPHTKLKLNDTTDTFLMTSSESPGEATVTMGTSILNYSQNHTSTMNSTLESANFQTGYVHPLLQETLNKDQLLSSFTQEDLLQLVFFFQATGVTIGALLGGLMADIFGRRRPLYLSLVAMVTFQCSIALSVSWMLFLLLRTSAVAFAGATIVVSFVTVIEFVGPSWRDTCTCSCLWTLGAVALSVECVVTSNWRWLALVSGGLAVPLLGGFYTSPESLRWLQCHHRFPAAEGIYREVVSVNSAAVPEMMALLDQARVCIVNNMHRKRYTFLDLFYNLTSARSTFALVYTSLMASCVYASLLNIVRNLTGNRYVDSCLPFLLDMPLSWSTVVINRCLGRRWCLFLYAVASGLALMSVIILHMTGNVASMPSLITGIALFGKIGVTATITLLFLIAIEMYPTVCRGMGVGVAVASGSGGVMLSQAFLFVERYHFTVPFMVYGLLMASVGLVGLLLPETLHLPLSNVQQCRHRRIPLVEGARLSGRPPFP